MPSLRYALVAYVQSAVGEFVENLRRELHPDLPHLPAHLTLLPPRQLRGSEPSALELLDDICSRVEPFEVVLGSVETFVPVTPTIYIGIERGPQRMHELHQQLNTGVLQCTEEWPYVPHLTIAKMTTEDLAIPAYATAQERWDTFSGSRRISVQNLTFVREEEQNRWVDVAGVPLGRSLVRP
jgi:2'-5' RNA ligase